MIEPSKPGCACGVRAGACSRKSKSAGARDTRRQPARCESLAIFARRGLEYANEGRSHLFFTTVPAIVGNRFDAIVRFFETPPGCIQADRLHRLGRRATAFFCIDSGEVSRTHT